MKRIKVLSCKTNMALLIVDITFIKEFMKSKQIVIYILFFLIFIGGCFESYSKVKGLFKKANRTKDINEKTSLYQQCIVLDPTFVNAYWKLAEIHEANAENDVALALWDQIVTFAPEWKIAYYNRGRLNAFMGHYNNAIEDFTKSINLGFDNFSSRFSRAIAYMENKNYTEACTEFTNLIPKKAKEAWKCYFYRGLSNFLNNNLQLAEEDFKKVLEFNKDYPPAIYNSSIALLKLNKIDESFNQISKYLEINPDFYGGFYVLSKIFKVKGDFSESLKNLNIAIEKNPESVLLLLNRADLLIKNNNYDPAINDFNKILELEPENKLIIFNRGKLKFLMNDKPGAESDFKEYCKLTNNVSEKKMAFEEAFKLPLSSANVFPRIDDNVLEIFYLDKDFLPITSPAKLDENYWDTMRSKTISKLKMDGVTTEKSMEMLKNNKLIAEIMESGDAKIKSYKLSMGKQILISIIIVLMLLGFFMYFKYKKPEQTPDEVYKDALACNIQEEKIKLLTKVLKMDPFYKSAYYRRALIYKELENYVEVVKDCNMLIRVDPENGEAYRLRGTAKKILGNISDAKDDFKMASDLKDSIYFIGKGIAKIKEGDFTNAIKEFDDAIIKNPEQPLAFANRGIAKSQSQNYEGAISDYTAAILLDPNYINAYKNRSQAYDKIGQNMLADDDKTKAEELEKLEKEKQKNKDKKSETKAPTTLPEEPVA